MKVMMSAKAIKRHERRVMAVRVIEVSKEENAAKRSVARAFKVTTRSIRRWLKRQREGRLHPVRLGRPPREVDRCTRQGVIALLAALGPLASVSSVRALFSEVPYRTIGRFKKRLACVRRRRRGLHEGRLTWFEPGRVWAMDFTWPKAKLPGRNNKLFVVRDLASGARLACVACRGERAITVIRTLKKLFLAHGAPLVLKHDNGGAFLAHKTLNMLEENDVHSLPSPVYRPQYSGLDRTKPGMDEDAHRAHRRTGGARRIVDDGEHRAGTAAGQRIASTMGREEADARRRVRCPKTDHAEGTTGIQANCRSVDRR